MHIMSSLSEILRSSTILDFCKVSIRWNSTVIRCYWSPLGYDVLAIYSNIMLNFVQLFPVAL